MKSGTWVGGAHAAGSFASRYGAQRDLLLRGIVGLDPATGAVTPETVRGDDLLYVNGDEIEFFEFIPG
jgi:small ligand-binding sensory domain FIST